MNIKRKILSYPLHPYLVCFYCLTKANADLHISPHYWLEMLGLLLFFWVVTAVLQLIFKFIWSSNTNGSIVLTIFLFINFFLFSIHKTINYILPFVERVRYSFLIVVSIGFIIALFLWLKREKTYKQISQYLTVLFLLFCSVDISKWIYDVFIGFKANLPNELSILNKNNHYNIYLIVPDGYASNENLLKYWHFDNEGFTTDLKNKGFFIAKNPRSNYRYTVQSISSMLNLNYFETFVTEPFMEAIIYNNTVMQFLSTHKYECNVTDFNEQSYVYNPNNIKIDIQTYLYDQSAIYFLGVSVKPSTNIDAYVNNIEILKSLFKDKKATPTFHYIHLMTTHHPYKNKKTDISKDTAYLNTFTVYSEWLAAQGNAFRTLGKRGDSILLNKYLGKIKETNIILQETLNESWDDIKNNSIIIIMSDHGFRFLNGLPTEYKPESYQNFCAVYFPDQDYSKLTDTITPINVMRMSVNKAIGSNMPYLPDKTNLR